MLECWTVGKGALIVNDCRCHCCRVSLLYRCACCYVLCILCCRLWASSKSPFLIFPAVKRKLEAREHRHLNYSWLFLYELHILFYSLCMGKINFADTLKFHSLNLTFLLQYGWLIWSTIFHFAVFMHVKGKWIYESKGHGAKFLLLCCCWIAVLDVAKRCLPACPPSCLFGLPQPLLFQ